MAGRVILHLGTPKSGTTFLQDVVWSNRELLAARGLLYPGHRRGMHKRASAAIRGLDDVPLHAWHRLRDELQGWPGTGLISHESLGAASGEQAARVLADLEPAHVSLVVTARNFADLLPSVWQQRLKRGVSTRLEDFELADDDGTTWSWRGLDPAGVLERWAASLPPEHVHVVVAPRPSTSDAGEELWRRFAAGCDLDPDGVRLDGVRANPSLRAPAAELLRRVLADLGPEYATPDVSRSWVKSRLAQSVLAGLDGPPLRVPPAALSAARARADRCVDRIRATGYHVVGDLDDLRPSGSADAGAPARTSDAELLRTATAAIAGLLDAWRAEHDGRGSRRPAR